MKAYWLSNGAEISAAELKANGVDYEKLDPQNSQINLDQKKKIHNYVAQEIVELNSKTPNLDNLLTKFDQEHSHPNDQVRFVIEGSGIYDIRSKADSWMRIELFPSDCISIPANRYHRFSLRDDRSIRFVRLFKDHPGVTTTYRPLEALNA